MMNHQNDTDLLRLLDLLIEANEKKNQKHYEGAIGLYLKALELFGEDSDLYAAIADCYFSWASDPSESGENYVAAIDWLNRAVTLSSNDARLHFHLAEYYQLGTLEYEQAAKAYRKTIELNPNYVSALVGGASLYGVPEKVVTLTEAIKWLEAATQLDPDNPNYLARLGEFYKEAGRVADAENAWRKSLICARPLGQGYVQLISTNVANRDASSED